MGALFGIFLQAPGAIWSGRFDVDEKYSVYGFPARLVGVLLMVLGLQAVTLLAAVAVRGKNRIPEELLPASLGVFFGCVVTSAVICAVFRKKRRPLAEPEREDEEDEDDDRDRRRRKPGGWRDWGSDR